MVTTEQLADLIREKSGIRVTSINKGKTTFLKEELLTIIAKFTLLEGRISETYGKVSYLEDLLKTKLEELNKDG